MLAHIWHIYADTDLWLARFGWWCQPADITVVLAPQAKDIKFTATEE